MGCVEFEASVGLPRRSLKGTKKLQSGVRPDGVLWDATCVGLAMAGTGCWRRGHRMREAGWGRWSLGKCLRQWSRHSQKLRRTRRGLSGKPREEDVPKEVRPPGLRFRACVRGV